MGLGNVSSRLFVSVLLLSLVSIAYARENEEEERRLSADSNGLPFSIDVELRERAASIKDNKDNLDEPEEAVTVTKAYGRMHFRPYKLSHKPGVPTWVTPYIEYRLKKEWGMVELKPLPLEDFVTFFRRVQYGESYAVSVQTEAGSWAFGTVDNLVVDISSEKAKIYAPVEISSLEEDNVKGQASLKKRELEIPLAECGDRLFPSRGTFSPVGTGGNAPVYFVEGPHGVEIPVLVIGYEQPRHEGTGPLSPMIKSPYSALLVLKSDADKVGQASVQIYQVPVGALRRQTESKVNDALTLANAVTADVATAWLGRYRVEVVKLELSREKFNEELSRAVYSTHQNMLGDTGEVPCDEIVRQHGDGTSN